MKILTFFLFLLISFSVFNGCSDSPSSKMKDEQFSLINDNVKKLLGQDYEAQNFTILDEGYTDQEKNSYAYKFTFDLNKQYLVFEGKKIPGELQFKKNNGGNWECVFNSGNALGLFNLLKIKQ